MNENNNMNNNYTNNPAPEQSAGDNMYQETTSQPQDQNTYQQAPAQDVGNMYHYNEQGTGQYQQPAQNTGQQYNTYGTDNQASGGYQYTDPAQQNAGQQYNTYGTDNQTFGGNGDQFTGGQNYNAGNAYNTYQTSGTNGQPPAHGKAVASLVLGIAGLVCCGICGLIGLILAISAKNEGNDEGIRKAGFILGIIGCALWAVGIVVAIINDSFSTWMY
ncbi:MAG: DUF4190 domain-containing protein [Clostridia bacterium]